MRWSSLRAMFVQVQLQEKEKLSLMAALHLERVRLRDSGGRDGLLQQGVDRLQRQRGEVRGSIVELLEELKYEAEGLLCSD